MKNAKILSLLLLSYFFGNCSKDNPETISTPVETVTYTNKIKGILELKCVSCHNASNASGGLKLDNYANTKVSMEEGAPDGLLTRINLNTGTQGVMPPSGKLDQATLDLFTKWKNDGLKE